MVGAAIHDGDLLVVDRSLAPRAGDVVVAVVDGLPSVKRFVRESGGYALAVENPAMPPFRPPPAAEVEIWGVVTWSFRRHRVQGR